MEYCELENITSNEDVVATAFMDSNELTNRLEILNGIPFNYILGYNGVVVYVGYSSKLCIRLFQHKWSNKEFDEIILIEFKDKKSALKMERELIKINKPKYNVQYLTN